jgi:peptidoglycan/xylan/chitin deacetylase (PgdA/CDA1 family)
LLGQLQRAGIHAVGFVNEGKLSREQSARTALLQQWLDAGMELGNHTYSHVNFWDTPLATYEQNVLNGERVTRRLLEAHKQRPRFFRHPYLNTGRTIESKQAFERFLAERGYSVAPVTIDNLDVLYALAYDNAYAARDSALMRRVAAAYIDHMRDSFEFFEALSQRLLNREPAQVLLLHANALNADHLHELVAMLRERGYTFVPLDSALKDPAYQLPDRYVGQRGPSWLQRWAITKGMDPGSEPRAPQWVERVAYPLKP